MVAKFKICNQNSEKECEDCHSSQRNYQKKLRRLKFIEISKMDEEGEHSSSEFYYLEHLETLDAETETGSAFYYQKPSVI